MSSMINRLRTLWIGGDDMAKFELLKSTSVTSSGTEYTIEVDESINEVIVYVVDANSNPGIKYTPIIFGASGEHMISPSGAGCYGLLVGSRVFMITAGYLNSNDTHNTIESSKSRACGIKTGSSWYSKGITSYVYGR